MGELGSMSHKVAADNQLLNLCNYYHTTRRRPPGIIPENTDLHHHSVGPCKGSYLRKAAAAEVIEGDHGRIVVENLPIQGGLARPVYDLKIPVDQSDQLSASPCLYFDNRYITPCSEILYQDLSCYTVQCGW